MKEEPKILEEGESTFRNGAGGLCGGVVSKSMFDSDPMAYMMAFYMEDKKFEEYKKEKNQEKRKKIFNEFAKSAI